MCDRRDIELIVDAQDPSLRAQIDQLRLPEADARAPDFNAAIAAVIVIIDRYEANRQQLAQRAIAIRKKEGKKIGGSVPYGYELDGEALVESRSEQRVIIAARRLLFAGHGWSEIARRLKAEGLAPRKGGKFHPTQIKRMTEGDDPPDSPVPGSRNVVR